jgi:cytochrome c-type biogenesis protein CcmH/NrfG
VGEEIVNVVGFDLLHGEQPDAALAAFRFNTTEHPQSANAWDSLGEAQAAAGDREAAIRSYETALRLEPGSASAADALRRLRAASSGSP